MKSILQHNQKCVFSVKAVVLQPSVKPGLEQVIFHSCTIQSCEMCNNLKLKKTNISTHRQISKYISQHHTFFPHSISTVSLGKSFH